MISNNIQAPQECDLLTGDSFTQAVTESRCNNRLFNCYRYRNKNRNRYRISNSLAMQSLSIKL